MADIHVLKGQIQPGANTGVYTFVLHLPTNATQTIKDKAVTDPDINGFESVVTDIDAAELTAIRSAELVEEAETINVHKDDPVAQLQARVIEEWQERAARLPAEFAKKYQWYLLEVSAS